MDRQEEIRRLAYELYERSGMIPGHEVENWLKAEKIVTARYAEAAKAEEKTAKPAVVRKPAAKRKASGTDAPKSPAGKSGTKNSAAPKKAPAKKSGR